MLIRREHDRDVDAVHHVVAEAFRSAAHSAPPVEPGGDPGETTLLGRLRTDPAWIPELSIVAVDGGRIIGHVVCTRAHVGERPALGLGPVSVLPDRQSSGVGSALMHAVLGAADALGEGLVGLLGEPTYYRRFGFEPAAAAGVVAPDASWGDYFQVRTLSAYDDHGGHFRYAAPFDQV